jgi:hypothetical protein
MSFSEILGNAAKKLQGNGFANEIGLPTLLFDIATVSSNDKNWVSDAFNIAGDTFRSTVLGASYPIRKTAGAAFEKVLLPTAMVSYNVGGRYLREPLSAALTTLATGDIKKSWENRDQISPGQALTYLQSRIPGTLGEAEFSADFDIFNPNDRKVFQTDWSARTVSGAYDTFFTTVTDPLGKIGKAAGLARKATVMRPLGAKDANAASLARDFVLPRGIRNTTIISPQTLSKMINEGREESGEIYNTLSWMAKSDRVAIRNHPMIEASNDADTLSYLLGEASTVDDVADTLMATALRDTEAMARLVQKRRDLSFVFDKLKGVSQADEKILNNLPTNGITDDVNKLDAASDLVKTVEKDPYFRMLNTFNDRQADLTKRTFGKPVFEKLAMNRAERRAGRIRGVDKPTDFPTVGVFQPTKYHPIIAVYNFGMRKIGDAFAETPAGYLNLNDSDSFNELTAFGELLRRLVGKEEAQPIIDRHLQDYIRAGGVPELRARVVESFEDLAISALNKKAGLTDEAAQVIWSQYKARRETARQMIKDRKFLMTDDDVILKIPYLERQGANALPMVDLQNYFRVIEKNKGFINTLNRQTEVLDPDSWKYTTGVLNDMWKASVLLRLGYTVRNLTEAGMSILGKGYGLMALGDLNREGFKSWYTNRVRDVERLTDRRLVAQGLREDSVKLRKQWSTLQTEIFAGERLLDDVYAHLAAFERAYRSGRLTDEQYMEVADVFQYATGEWLFHGTSRVINDLDTTRPLAMSTSQDIAERYATASMPRINASEIYKRISGRAYPMPKNLRSRETGELIKQPARKPSKAMETIAADMRDGFINSVNNGNSVEVLNPSTGRWTTIDPNTVTQKMLLNGEFRIRKPGNEGITLSQKVYGRSVNLVTFRGNQARLGLEDYPELQKILGITGGANQWKNRAAWEGKEQQLLEWMRANGVGKLTLPDNKANGYSTVLVDPEMVEAFGRKPTEALARKRLEAIKKQQQLLSEDARILQIIERTMAQGGGTFKFSDNVSGDVPTKGVAVSIRGATHAFSLEDARNNPQAWVDSVAAHIEANFDKFGDAQYFGTWIDDIDGVPHIKSDPVNVIENRGKAIKIGKDRNQQGVFDIGNLEYIDTKGTGDVGASAAFALGKGTKAVKPDELTRTQSVRRVTRPENFRQRVNEISESIGRGKYPTEGLATIVREIADGQATRQKELKALLQRLNGRIVEEERLGAPKAIQGTGRRILTLYDGTKVEVDDAFAGELGSILLDRTNSAETYRRFVDHPAQLFAAEHGNFVEETLTPAMPDYYAGYANSLNSFFRSPDGRIDPIIEQMLNNARPEEIVAWLRNPDNVEYARRFNIDVPGIKVASERLDVSIDAEDFVGDLYSAYNRYLPDRQVQEAFRNGEITESWLREHFAEATEMPDIIGRIVPTSPQARNWQEGLAKVVDRAFYFLGSLPETTLARHPLARQIYRSDMTQRMDIALATKRMRLNDNKLELTVDEINGLRRDAIEATRKEVNKTLFTIIRKSYAGEKMRFIMPFFNAWENTIRRWSGLAKENPAVIARAGQIVSSLRNQPNVVDQDGNPTTEFSYENKIVVPMSEGVIEGISKIPVWGKGMAEAIRSTGTQVSIPIRSMDVIMQGEVIAGFGPIVTLPVNEIVKLKPDLEDIVTSSVLPVLPFGPQEGSLRQLFPPAAQKLASLAGQDELWSRTFNTVYRYELIRYNLGERDTMPELKEVADLTSNFYKVRILSNLVMPFAAQYDSPLSFYTQQFRRLQQVYGQDAEVLFLQMYPEMGPALVSASYNPTGAQASQAAFQNIQKYKGLIGKIGQTTPEMIGFLVNDPDGKYDFSEAVYAWQYGNAPVPGSTENYRARRNPAELKKDANIKVGWIEFRKNMDLLDYQLEAQGYESYNESGAEELQTLKQMMVADLTRRNQDWAADYYSVDRGKWIYRMESMRTMLSDPKWMAENGRRPVVQSIAVYLNMRTQIARELANRKAYGMASTLTAEDNADLDALWNSTIAQLRKGSPEFGDFYNRFLQNDPVTLG